MAGNQPYVLLSQGKVDEESGVLVLDTDILFENPAVTRPTKVERLKSQMELLRDEGVPMGRWITVCDEWLEEHHDTNPE